MIYFLTKVKSGLAIIRLQFRLGYIEFIMAHRQRNIPVTSKQEVQIQTDVRLLDNTYFDSDNQDIQARFARSVLRQRGGSQANSLLRPFSDHELLRDFHKCVKDMKDQPYNQDQFKKRLSIIESQINGLLKRDYLVSSSYEGSEAWLSYYSTLNQKEKDIIRLQNEKIYSDLKNTRLSKRIQALEEEINQLRVSLVHSTQALQQNKMYASFYEKLTKIINNGHKKGSEIQKLFEEQMLPVYNEFNFNLTAVTRLINKEMTVNTRPLVQSMAKEFDRLLKEQQLTQEKHSDVLISLLDNFRAVKGVSYLKDQFDLAQRAETAEDKFKNMLSLFKHQIGQLQSSHPHLKGAEQLDWLLRKLQDQGIDMIECKGWINLSTSSIRVHEVHGEDKQLRELLGVLAGEFKRIYTKFPQLHQHCSSRLVQLFQSELLAQLVAGASIDRLKEIIIHEVETVRVEDVYKYQNSKDVKTMFHLRVLIKKLLDELMRCRSKYEIEIDLDQALLAMLRDQGLDLNLQEIIEGLRPPSRFIEVPVVVENKVYESHTYEKAVPINRTQPYVITEEKLQVVAVNKQIPVYIQKAVECITTQQIPVSITTERILQVPTNRDVIVDRIVETCREVPVEIERIVAAYDREEIIKEVEVDKVIRDIEYRDVERIVESKVQEILQVETIVEKLVTATEFKELIRQVEVKVPYIITKTEMVEIEKKIPYIIEKEIPVQVRIEVPVEIRVPELQFVEICEYRDKPIVTTNTVEKPVYVELTVEKQLIRQVAKQIYIDRSHFIKGDKEEQIREVQVFVDKPIIQEVMVTRDVQIQKLVPLYIKEEVPVITEIKTPFITERVQEIQVEKIQIVNARQQVVKTVNIDKPVPVIIERQIVKVQPQIIEKIVEKIVQVPRIVEIQKIVEKIVVVPRIIEKIVEVPRIIEKIVIVREPELHIVQILVPQIIIQEVQIPVEVEVIRTVIVKEKEIETVEVEKLIECRVTEEKAVEVFLEKRIPYQVIKEVPVETYRDRIEYQTVEIHETKVEPIEVQVPFIVQEKVPFVVEKEVRTHDIIKEVQLEKIYIQKEKAVIKREQKLVVQEVIIEKPIIQREVIEVPGPETIVRLTEQEAVEVIREKVVQVEHYVEHIKEIILEQQKIVPVIHEKLITVAINELVTTPELIEVPKIVNLTHYKEILVKDPVREQRMETTIVESVKAVEQRIQVPTEVEITREKIREIVNDVKCIVNNETIREITNQVQILMPTETRIVEVPGETIIQELRSETKSVEVEDRMYEKLVEKIVMLPQIVEVIKNIHHISEVNQLGVAVDVDINVQVQKFAGVSSELKKALVQLLSVFKSNAGRQPDLKNLIVIIEKHMKHVDDWISFPKLVQIQKKVEVEVTKERLVVVPSENKERQSTLSFIMEKMITQLRRIKDSHKISLNLDDDIQRLFFTDRVYDEDIERRVTELRESYISRRQSMGEVNLSGSNIEQTLRMEAYNSSLRVTIKEQEQELDRLRRMLDSSQNESTTLKTVNHMMVDSNNHLLKTLEKHKQVIDKDEFQTNVKIHRTIYDDLIEHHRSTVFSSVQRSQYVSESKYVSHNVQESEITQYREEYVGELVSKLNKYEAENQKAVNKSKIYESQITRFTDELNVKNSIIKRLEGDFESKLSRAREELSKNPNVSQDLLLENKRLLQKTRSLEKECSAEKQISEKAKRDLERSTESQKRDVVRDLERKEREYRDTLDKNKKQFDREIKRLSDQFERLRRSKEKLESETAQLKSKHSEEIKNIREQQLGGATDKHNQLLNENIALRKKFDNVEVEYEQLKKAAVDNNTANQRETHKLRTQIERLQIEKREWVKKQKEGFLDLPEQTKLINIKIQMERKIKTMEADLSKYRNKDQNSITELRGLREKVKNLEVQLQISRKQLEATHKMRSTTFQSGYKSGISSTEYMAEGSVAKSPRGGVAYYKSAEEKREFVSPQSIQSEERIEELGSSSSRFSHESSEERSLYKSQMTLREFMQVKHGDDKERDVCMTFVMIKIIEAVEKDAENGLYYSYAPNNINLYGFDVRHLDRLTVKFGGNIINKNARNDGLYLAPEVLGGSVSTKKSVVFCLGVILDELIHGGLFFRSMQEIQNLQIEFKVRGEKLNPILKNTLFQMMNKEPSKRLQLIEAKRRLSLQKYITAEGRGSVTTQQRITRRREE